MRNIFLFFILFILIMLTACNYEWFPVIRDNDPDVISKKALSIGIYDYRYISNIPFCFNDSMDFEIVMGKNKGETEIATLTGNIIRSDILKKIEEFSRKKYNQDDVFYLHYAGHGGLKDDRAFLAMGDYPRINGSMFYVNELRVLLDKIPCKKVILIDACNSEEFTQLSPGKNSGMTDDSQAFIKNVMKEFSVSGETISRDGSSDRKSPGYYVMVGCAKNESSWESAAHKNGLFSFYIFDGLGMSGDENPDLGFNNSYDADINSDRNITFDELYKYVYAKVSTKIINGSSDLQHPKVYPANSDFVIFKY